MIAALLALLLMQAPAETAQASPLAAGARLYVQPCDRTGVCEEVTAALKDWGRWIIVETPRDATLFATVKLTGSGAKGTMRLTITETPEGPTLWQGYDEGRKNPYRKGDAFTRTLAVIMEQLRTASERWPAR